MEDSGTGECPGLLSVFLHLHGIGLKVVANSGRCLLFLQKNGEAIGGMAEMMQ